MADAASPELHILRRQYFQLVEPHQLTWPDNTILKDPHIQSWMYAQMFDGDHIEFPPPDHYQLRVLKPLISKLENAIEDPEEDVRHPISSQWHSIEFLVSTTSLLQSTVISTHIVCHVALSG
jgi:hypothetical protein